MLKKSILALCCLAFASQAFAFSEEITSSSATPTVKAMPNTMQSNLTAQLTVGSGDTCLVEFSATPTAATSGVGNWQPVPNLSSVTANAFYVLTGPVQALRVTLTAGTGPCVLDLSWY